MPKHMNNWKQSPLDSSIAKYIDCYWLIEKKSEDIYINYPKLNPDPGGHLILAPAYQTYHYQFGNTSIKSRGCHMILPNTGTITMDHSRPFLILGIKFHVGALYSLKFKNVFPLINFVLSCTDFLPTELDKVNSASFFNEATNQIQLTCAKLDELLLPWVQKSHEDKHSSLVREAISIFNQTPISEMGNSLYCSQRTIERAFRRVTGLTLKQYESMTRLETLLTYLYQKQNDPLNWADIATQFGFSDQPHLIRYLKDTIGATPNDYLKQRDITIDVYGDFD